MLKTLSRATLLALTLATLNDSFALGQEAVAKDKDIPDFRGLAWGSSPDDAMRRFPSLRDVGSADVPKSRKTILAMEDEIRDFPASVMFLYLDKRLQKAVISLPYDGLEDLNAKMAVLIDGVGSKYGAYTDSNFDPNKLDETRLSWKRKSATVFIFSSRELGRVTASYETPVWTKTIKDEEEAEKHSKF